MKFESKDLLLVYQDITRFLSYMDGIEVSSSHDRGAAGAIEQEVGQHFGTIKISCV